MNTQVYFSTQFVWLVTPTYGIRNMQNITDKGLIPLDFLNDLICCALPAELTHKQEHAMGGSNPRRSLADNFAQALPVEL